MKILLVSPGGDKFGGGMGTVTKNIKDYIENSSSDEVRVFDSRGEVGFALSFLFFFKALVGVFSELLFSKQPTLLHINVSERFSFVRKAAFIALARGFKVKTILHHHGAELIPFYEGASPLKRRITEYCITRTDCNLVLGEKWRRFIIESVPNHAPIEILYNAVPRKVVADGKSSAMSLSMIANLSERKGVVIMLEAIAKVKNSLDVRVDFLGGGDTEKYALKAKALGVDHLCHFHGWLARDKALSIMYQSHALVLPSYDEGLPMVILEAMAQGVPVICTPVGSIGEVFTHEKECLFVDVGSADSLAEAILRLLSDSELQQQLVDNATQTYERQFSIENYMSCLENIYQKL
ncbi:glycosyltransferase family 4 protein [Aliiglaciecola sp. M165]|uniref:glycosyltransferase family 4 protein n=1 Tax=Aliiglaciecola sp. M165 TaxID=2593649 RepID=UPI00117C2265|nr:glycosyltransferase family 4 protein [Aliiglaciecola sp. M165]TRY32836.1 glycosyltransferase family 4 protein [Aliiglaciecola sp. M165]